VEGWCERGTAETDVVALKAPCWRRYDDVNENLVWISVGAQGILCAFAMGCGRRLAFNLEVR
jgi:23S rRNA C2498 (ribose-2'-O)-methylase RlmM